MTSPLDPPDPIARLRPGGRMRTPASRPLRHRRILPTSGNETGDTADGGSGGKPLREWHRLAPAERTTAWAELVDWVIWLHDRYELAVEERLPRCWPQHPGLIEELAALKAWRQDIYTADQPAGQAARYWHGELRQVLTAATTVYAAGCRVGHKDPAGAVATDPQLRERWLAADPLAGTPPALLTTTATGTPSDGAGLALADALIQVALAQGTARPLGQTVAEFVHHQKSWWAADPPTGTWRQVTDPALTAHLDRAAERMATADAAVAARRRIHDAL